MITTEVEGLHGISIGDSVILTWDVYAQPILAGYNIYRRDSSGEYPSQPFVELDMIGNYTDRTVEAGQGYFYKLCSYDLDGYQHICNEEIFVRVGEDSPDSPIFLPIVLTY